ncbi:MAG: hypothetical protein ACKO96_25040, partial [Flammeovirgaceae bacterium]
DLNADYPALIGLLSNKHPQSYLGTPTIQRKKPFLNGIQRFSLVAQKNEELRKILEGNGKHMRHIKLRPESSSDDTAIQTLIEAAYNNIQKRIRLW